MEKLEKALEERLEKAKYTKRTGGPGSYKYQYGPGKEKGKSSFSAQKYLEDPHYKVEEKKGEGKLTVSSAIEKEMQSNRTSVDVDFLSSELRAMKNIGDRSKMPAPLQKQYDKLMRKHKIKEKGKIKEPDFPDVVGTATGLSKEQRQTIDKKFGNGNYKIVKTKGSFVLVQRPNGDRFRIERSGKLSKTASGRKY